MNGKKEPNSCEFWDDFDPLDPLPNQSNTQRQVSTLRKAEAYDLLVVRMRQCQ